MRVGASTVVQHRRRRLKAPASCRRRQRELGVGEAVGGDGVLRDTNVDAAVLRRCDEETTEGEGQSTTVDHGASEKNFTSPRKKTKRRRSSGTRVGAAERCTERHIH